MAAVQTAGAEAQHPLQDNLCKRPNCTAHKWLRTPGAFIWAPASLRYWLREDRGAVNLRVAPLLGEMPSEGQG